MDGHRAGAAVLGVRSGMTLLAGLAIAWVDSRPNWDDTGISAGLVLITAAVATFTGVKPWLTALCVAGPLIIVGLSRGNAGSLLALLFALAGAYGAALTRRLLA
jgi:hypothetical protein